MKRYLVTVETLKRNAIGEFSPSTYIVEMHQSSFSTAEIYRSAIRQAHEQTLETRFPISCQQIRSKGNA